MGRIFLQKGFSQPPDSKQIVSVLASGRHLPVLLEVLVDKFTFPLGEHLVLGVF